MRKISIYDIKFSFGQMTSNDTGKTSATATAGVFCFIIGLPGFLFGIIDYSFISKTQEIMSQTLLLLTLGSGLLSWNKHKEGSISLELLKQGKDALIGTEEKTEEVKK